MLQRAPNSSATQPTIGPPIGVLPRNSIACSARTRPRISGAARTCTIAVDDTMNVIEKKPSTSPSAKADSSPGTTAITASVAPYATAAKLTWRTPTSTFRALIRAPTREPTLTSENRMVNVEALPPRSRVTNRGKTVGKL